MTHLKPRFPIRRFDVFAEYQRVHAESTGTPVDQAKGYGIWTAKVVAGRRGRGGPAPKSSSEAGRQRAPNEHDMSDDESGYRSVGGELQTAQTFDREIIARMGEEFYQQVFHPAIEQAHADGKQYADIRDAIRKEWK